MVSAGCGLDPSAASSLQVGGKGSCARVKSANAVGNRLLVANT